MSRNVHEHKINISELRVIMNYIGIDLGTSAVKLLLMEGSGKILKIVSREYQSVFPNRDGRSRIRMTGLHSQWMD